MSIGGQTVELRPATTRDVTMERAAEDAVREVEAQSVELLAGGIAHDFNNVLTAILGPRRLAARR